MDMTFLSYPASLISSNGEHCFDYRKGTHRALIPEKKSCKKKWCNGNGNSSDSSSSKQNDNMRKSDHITIRNSGMNRSTDGNSCLHDSNKTSFVTRKDRA